jgi:hypothetical protein
MKSRAALATQYSIASCRAWVSVLDRGLARAERAEIAGAHHLVPEEERLPGLDGRALGVADHELVQAITVGLGPTRRRRARTSLPQGPSQGRDLSIVFHSGTGVVVPGAVGQHTSSRERRCLKSTTPLESGSIKTPRFSFMDIFTAPRTRVSWREGETKGKEGQDACEGRSGRRPNELTRVAAALYGAFADRT